MAKLTMCKGLPGSGKSTFARNQELTSTYTTIVVNKDSIRNSLGEPWSREVEKKVLNTRDYLIDTALKAGKDVISDDTNLAPKHEHCLRNLAKKHGAQFIIKEFDTPLEECIRRDALRPDAERVGEKVIIDMYFKYLAPQPKPKPK